MSVENKLLAYFSETEAEHNALLSFFPLLDTNPLPTASDLVLPPSTWTGPHTALNFIPYLRDPLQGLSRNYADLSLNQLASHLDPFSKTSAFNMFVPLW